MGDKIASRRAAAAAGVPGVPGTLEPVRRAADLRAVADAYGLPVVVKAAHGGGGRGLRVVRRAEDLDRAFEAARREADAYFANPEVYVERYLEGPRHIEAQVLCDRHGNAVFLGERDCSLQRRHQKLVEEAPSPALSARQRRDLGKAAVAVARAAHYESAGTVEFLLDRDGSRLLPGDEHPPPGGARRHRGGHRHRPGQRATAPRRRGAAGRGRGDPPGPRHRVPHQRRGPRPRLPPPAGPHHRVPRAGRPRGAGGLRLRGRGGRSASTTTTSSPSWWCGEPTGPRPWPGPGGPWASSTSPGCPPPSPSTASIVDLPAFREGTHDTRTVEAGPRPERPGPARARARRPTPAAAGRTMTVEVGGRRFEVRLWAPEPPAPKGAKRPPARRRGPAPAALELGEPEGLVTAPMQGTIVKVHHRAGEAVEAGEPLFVLEAMKMENELRAPSPARSWTCGSAKATWSRPARCWPSCAERRPPAARQANRPVPRARPASARYRPADVDRSLRRHGCPHRGPMAVRDHDDLPLPLRAAHHRPGPGGGDPRDDVGALPRSRSTCGPPSSGGSCSSSTSPSGWSPASCRSSSSA